MTRDFVQRACHLMVLLVLLLGIPATAQDSSYLPVDIVTYQAVNVFGGPGVTYPQVGYLNAEVPARVVERNATGTWVHVLRYDAAGNTILDGWIISGYIQGRSQLDFAAMPANTTIPDNLPANSGSASLGDLYAAPIIPAISPAMLEVYRLGQALGNLPNVITKIGDSLSASDEYLEPMANPARALNAYRYLAETIDYYGPSMAVDSVAADIGMSSAVVFDPMWADATRGCLPGETPLECEYRLKRPSVAFIMFGPNDARSMTPEVYSGNMRRIIETTLARGIIPVVSTFAVHPNDDLYWQGIELNRVLLSLAAEYEIPLINLWAATHLLPNYGLDADNVHLTVSGHDQLYYDAGNDAYSGVALHNLLSIRVLHSIREAVQVASLPAAAATPEVTPVTGV